MRVAHSNVGVRPLSRSRTPLGTQAFAAAACTRSQVRVSWGGGCVLACGACIAAAPQERGMAGSLASVRHACMESPCVAEQLRHTRTSSDVSCGL